MKEPKNLTTAEAIEFLKSEYDRMSKMPKEFKGEDPDKMFLDGYRIAIADLEASTKPRK